ncbi:hypothetical protein BC831DRAFT_506487 [Entophlyctis helioformis]|nr:hypothetical protein BC831DRAFT_506487 [Entophlyctis helioformis]
MASPMPFSLAAAIEAPTVASHHADLPALPAAALPTVSNHKEQQQEQQQQPYTQLVPQGTSATEGRARLKQALQQQQHLLPTVTVERSSSLSMIKPSDLLSAKKKLVSPALTPSLGSPKWAYDLFHHPKDESGSARERTLQADGVSGAADGAEATHLRAPSQGVPRTKSTSKSQSAFKDVEYDPLLFDILDVPPKEVARQLTLLSSEYFRRLVPAELESLAWTKPEKDRLTPAIVQITNHFNQIAIWVAQQILDAKAAKRRFQLICYYIRVAKYCLDYNNFDSVRSVVAGLQSTPVHRLERTWAMIGRRERSVFDKLAELASLENNNDVYRRRLAQAKPPCVPYLGTHLGDLTFVFECLKKDKGNPQRAKQYEERHAQFYVLIADLDRWRMSCTYNFTRIKCIIDAISQNVILPDQIQVTQDDHYRLSYMIEAKGSGGGGGGGGHSASTSTEDGSAGGDRSRGTHRRFDFSLRANSSGVMRTSISSNSGNAGASVMASPTTSTPLGPHNAGIPSKRSHNDRGLSGSNHMLSFTSMGSSHALVADTEFGSSSGDIARRGFTSPSTSGRAVAPEDDANALTGSADPNNRSWTMPSRRIKRDRPRLDILVGSAESSAGSSAALTPLSAHPAESSGQGFGDHRPTGSRVHTRMASFNGEARDESRMHHQAHQRRHVQSGSMDSDSSNDDQQDPDRTAEAALAASGSQPKPRVLVNNNALDTADPVETGAGYTILPHYLNQLHAPLTPMTPMMPMTPMTPSLFFPPPPSQPPPAPLSRPQRQTRDRSLSSGAASHSPKHKYHHKRSVVKGLIKHIRRGSRPKEHSRASTGSTNHDHHLVRRHASQVSDDEVDNALELGLIELSSNSQSDDDDAGDQDEGTDDDVEACQHGQSRVGSTGCSSGGLDDGADAVPGQLLDHALQRKSLDELLMAAEAISKESAASSAGAQSASRPVSPSPSGIPPPLPPKPRNRSLVPCAGSVGTGSPATAAAAAAAASATADLQRKQAEPSHTACTTDSSSSESSASDSDASGNHNEDASSGGTPASPWSVQPDLVESHNALARSPNRLARHGRTRSDGCLLGDTCGTSSGAADADAGDWPRQKLSSDYDGDAGRSVSREPLAVRTGIPPPVPPKPGRTPAQQQQQQQNNPQMQHQRLKASHPKIAVVKQAGMGRNGKTALLLQGILQKKEETEDDGSRAKKRDWVRVWAVLDGHVLKLCRYDNGKGSSGSGMLDSASKLTSMMQTRQQADNGHYDIDTLSHASEARSVPYLSAVSTSALSSAVTTAHHESSPRTGHSRQPSAQSQSQLLSSPNALGITVIRRAQFAKAMDQSADGGASHHQHAHHPHPTSATTTKPVFPQHGHGHHQRQASGSMGFTHTLGKQDSFMMLATALGWAAAVAGNRLDSSRVRSITDSLVDLSFSGLRLAPKSRTKPGDTTDPAQSTTVLHHSVSYSMDEVITFNTLTRADAAPDYSKHKYVFRVQPVRARSFLLRARTGQEMDTWIQALRTSVEMLKSSF